jgi:DNA-binding GntR family transcriptional regulator
MLKIQQGTWIDEQTLAADYGIRRTSLRKALKVLASEGSNPALSAREK